MGKSPWGNGLLHILQIAGQPGCWLAGQARFARIFSVLARTGVCRKNHAHANKTSSACFTVFVSVSIM